MLRFYTGNMYKYNGPDKLDVTVKTSKGLGEAFKPSWPIVNKWRAGSQKIEDEIRYTEKYRELMRTSFRTLNESWKELLAMDRVVLCCYCGRDSFCHRFLLAAMLIIQGAQYMGEIDDTGVVYQSQNIIVNKWLYWFTTNK